MTAKMRVKTLKANDLSSLIKNSSETRSTAEQMISEAKCRATEIIEEAKQEAGRQHEMLKDLSQDTLKSYINEDRIKRHAAVFVDMLKIRQDIRDTHNILAPWFVSVVKTSVEKLIGEFDEPEAIARIVAVGIDDLDQNYAATLRCSVTSMPDLKLAMGRRPELFRGVESFVPDQTLAEGEMFLDCHAGSIEITLSSQLGALLDAIDEALCASQKSESDS